MSGKCAGRRAVPRNGEYRVYAGKDATVALDRVYVFAVQWGARFGSTDGAFKTRKNYCFFNVCAPAGAD